MTGTVVCLHPMSEHSTLGLRHADWTRGLPDSEVLDDAAADISGRPVVTNCASLRAAAEHGGPDSG